MPVAVNEDIAGRLDEVARIFAEQGANRFRVQAYHQAAAVLRGLARPVSEIFSEAGLAGLEKLPGVGESIARAIRDILRHGRLAMLGRLRGEHDPIALRIVRGREDECEAHYRKRGQLSGRQLNLISSVPESSE